MNNIFDKFSHNFQNSLKTAIALAVELNNPAIEPEHLLYGLASQRGSVGAELFTALKIKPLDIKNGLAKMQVALPASLLSTKSLSNSEKITTLKKMADKKSSPKFSPVAKEIIQKSLQLAYHNKHNYVGTEHLLAAILESQTQTIINLFKEIKLSEPELARQVEATLKSASKLPDLTATFRLAGKKNKKTPAEATEALNFFGRNLTSKKFQDQIDPVIGREEEINRVIQILCRRTKNNPLLIGEPGVGKTAIAEGLAKKIASGEVPEILANKKIYSLDMAAALAGTMYRGEFESRLKQIIDEATDNPNIILFIDEIHTIVGAGSASGSMDAANILKPALARGEIHCIGATTISDYRKSIEGDPAFARRFQIVKIEEPTTEQAKGILFGLRASLEDFHQVKITDEAIITAVELSQKFLPDKFLPDKAIDLLDEASSAGKIGRKHTTSEIKLKELKRQVEEIKRQKITAINTDDLAYATLIKRDLEILEKDLATLEKSYAKQTKQRLPEVTASHIANIVAKSTGIPTEKLTASEKSAILKLEKDLTKKIIGQDEALKSITDLIKRAKAGLGGENRPLASFIFVGPSGVGKTYAAKELAKAIFQDEKALIKIDMSEYSEKFNISKMIGAPAGYVGYKESGQLTEKVKHRPHSLILLDEIDKAHRDVFDLLLQILEDGYLTDAVGSKINFQNTVIIMTANIGSEHFKEKLSIGFGERIARQELTGLKEKIVKEVKNHFKPEFINRVDKIVYFNPLTATDLKKIVILELNKLKSRLEKKKIQASFSPQLIEFIAKKSWQPSEGARAVKKVIQELVENQLADQILTGKISGDNAVQIEEKNGIIIIKK